ncbi:MAG TPA: L-threonylcarbamoyladenylate synthase [Candidatus Paceibacterota bacterium]
MHRSKSPLYSFLKDISTVASLISGGAIGVIPTDTIYGIVVSALVPASVERLYAVRGRDRRKPCIILISAITELAQFGIISDEKLQDALARVWPGAVSVILDCPDEKFTYLHRGTKTLSFRLPEDETLKTFLEKSGPLVAPSANPEGKPPARDITEAESYFGDTVDFYVDGGERGGEPSTLVRYKRGDFTEVRRGSIQIPE